MSTTAPFTIDQFYKFIGEKKLMAAKCNKCGIVMLPPKPACTQCYSTDFSWIQLGNKGKLLTYTIIHIAPEQFQTMAPYAFGIVELDHGLRLPGMIHAANNEQIEIDMKLEIDYDTNVSKTWPQWPRYYFKPL